MGYSFKLIVLALGVFVEGFVPHVSFKHPSSCRLQPYLLSASTADASSSSSVEKKNVIVIGPTNGVCEVAATTLAKMGNSVRWFAVYASDDSSSSLSLPRETWSFIQQSGGSLDVTGGDAEGLLLPDSDPRSSLRNVEQWVAVNALAEGTVDGIIVGLDVGEEQPAKKQQDDSEGDWQQDVSNAVKRVTQMACGSLPASVPRIQLLPLPSSSADGSEEEADEGGLKNWLPNPFKGDNAITLREAIRTTTSGQVADSTVVTLRHGALFGLPESNKEASPFVGGPRRDPRLRDEYINRNVLLSPTSTITARKAASSTRTSRFTLAETAIRTLDDPSSRLSKFPVVQNDVTVASLQGSMEPTDQDWKAEFDRLFQSAAAAVGKDGSTVIFETSYASVPNVKKLADWIAFKWAPTVLSSYDIAGIRTGARPVFAQRVDKAGEEDEEGVEILWQKLVNFEDVKTVGKMTIKVSDGGMVASRTAMGEVLSGTKPFPGEDVLLRRLMDASVQAAEKGLAKKAKKARAPAPEPATVPPPPVVSSSVAASGTVPKSSSKESGPRTSGAKRPTRRKRGGKKDA